jgi:hypothetical protein
MPIPKANQIHLLKRGDNSEVLDSPRVMDLLEGWKPFDHGQINQEFAKLGLFLKMSYTGNIVFNTSASIEYQFDWLMKAYPALPENIARPAVLINILQEGNTVPSAGYLVERVTGRTLHNHFDDMEYHFKKGMEDWSYEIPGAGESDIVTQLRMILKTLNKLKLRHNDISDGNVLLRDDTRKVVLIDPMHPDQWWQRIARAIREPDIRGKLEFFRDRDERYLECIEGAFRRYEKLRTEIRLLHAMERKQNKA